MAHASTNPWTGWRVLAYAHQGGAWEAPSSTLFAVERALRLGATGIELDVHATADGELVVCHDATVDRTSDGSGAISTMTFAAVRALDPAHWFVPGSDATFGLDPGAYPYRGRAPADPAFRIPTVDEVLEVLDAFPDAALNLDIKATAPAVAPYEEALARTLARHGRTERIVVASFFDRATETFARYAPDVATSAGAASVAEFFRAVRLGLEPPPTRHRALQVPATRGGMVVVDEPFVDAAHRTGLAVHVWTINDEKEMARLLDLGVDGIISDVPTPLVRLLEERGETYRP